MANTAGKVYKKTFEAKDFLPDYMKPEPNTELSLSEQRARFEDFKARLAAAKAGRKNATRKANTTV